MKLGTCLLPRTPIHAAFYKCGKKHILYAIYLKGPKERREKESLAESIVYSVEISKTVGSTKNIYIQPILTVNLNFLVF